MDYYNIVCNSLLNSHGIHYKDDAFNKLLEELLPNLNESSFMFIRWYDVTSLETLVEQLLSKYYKNPKIFVCDVNVDYRTCKLGIMDVSKEEVKEVVDVLWDNGWEVINYSELMDYYENLF